MNKIIAVSGKSGSGKSLLAKKLKTYGFLRISLASYLKKMCQELYGLTDYQVYGKGKDEPSLYGITPREILIREGFVKRSVDPDFWCKKLVESISLDDMPEVRYKYVIDDVRYKNEVKFLREFGTVFVRLERDVPQVSNDSSETELDNHEGWDFTLMKELNRVETDLEKFAEYISLHV